MTFRFFRAQRVRLRPQTFSDSADSHADVFLTSGATIPSLPEVPRGGVRRLLDFDEPEKSLLSQNWPGYGAGEPHVSLRRPAVVRVGRAPGRSTRPIPLLQALRRADSWRAFRQLRVAQPGRDALCVRRLQRKQVLFAKGVAGRSGSAPGPYRRNQFSSWSC